MDQSGELNVLLSVEMRSSVFPCMEAVQKNPDWFFIDEAGRGIAESILLALTTIPLSRAKRLFNAVNLKGRFRHSFQVDVLGDVTIMKHCSPVLHVRPS